MRVPLLLAMLVLAGCSQREPEGSAGNMIEQARGPNVGVTQMAGVAMTYQYGFRIPSDRITAVQEEHASQCEAMTPARCRVTGMSYDVGRDRRIAAMLQVRLAPDVARRFGKQGVDIIVKRGGMLVSARIDSEEAGAVIDAAKQDGTEIVEERRRTADQLARSGLGSAERAELQARLADLSDDRRQVRAASVEAAARLASTPMTFTYVSGAVDPGLNDGPILGAIKDGWANVVGGLCDHPDPDDIGSALGSDDPFADLAMAAVRWPGGPVPSS